MITAVIFDLDGTLYLGDSPVDGAGRALQGLRASGRRIFFLSNAASSSRRQQAIKLRSMGIEARPSEIYNSAYAVADYASRTLRGKKLHVICEGGMQRELRNKGIYVSEVANANVVAIGLDRKFTWKKLAAASAAIRRGAFFMAANLDPTYPAKDGLKPGAGSIVAAVETAAGRKPDIVLGKPNTYMLEEIAKEHKLKKEEMLIVGDRYETDILAAKNFGIRSVAVLTGVLTQKDIAGLKDKPEYVLASVRELPGLLEELINQQVKNQQVKIARSSRLSNP